MKPMLKNSATILVFVLIAMTTFVQSFVYGACFSTGGDYYSGHDSQRDDDGPDAVLSAALQDVLDSVRDSLAIAGVSAAVVGPGGWNWTGVSGRSSAVEDINRNMLFGIGSVTKTYTASLIMQYALAGALSLDDPVSTWLPATRFVDSSITVRQLLNHTSGTFNYMAHPGYNAAMMSMPETLWTAETLLGTFLAEPVSEPGVEWSYSATNYLLLGMIIEEISGSAVAAEIREHLLDPMNFRHTYLYPDEVYVTERMAHLWMALDSSGIPVDVNELLPDPPFIGLFSSVWTAGAMHATALDVARWLQGLLEGRALPMSSVREMVKPVEASGAVRYGFGIMTEEIDGTPAYGHSGGIGYSSLAFYFPDDSVAISVLCNSDTDPRPIAGALHRLVADRGRDR
jgi:D-alanyl-D-alanine carboxypeptidase